MNAILKQKQARAQELAHDRIPTSERQQAALDWWLEHGAPHRRDHFWSYTDPEGFYRGEPSGQSEPLDWLMGNVTLEEHALPQAGSLVENAHKKGQRPIAEWVIMQAKPRFAKIRGKGNILVLNDENFSKHALISLEVDAHAELTIFEYCSNAARRQSVLEIFAQEGAHINHIRIMSHEQDYVHSHVFAQLNAAAQYYGFSLSKSASFLRHETIIDLIGEGAHASVSAGDFLEGQGLNDHTIYISHLAPNCTSRQIAKRVLKGAARSVFQGKIFVDPIAQKTDGYQISNALMLSDEGEVLNKPELEIYADDVVCSHGSTSSGLDKNGLFYMQARGIAENMAEKLLILAFLQDSILEIPEQNLQARVSALVEKWVLGAPLEEF